MHWHLKCRCKPGCEDQVLLSGADLRDLLWQFPGSIRSVMWACDHPHTAWA